VSRRHDDWIAQIRPGDTVVVAQGVSEPTPLLRDLLQANLEDIEVIVGLSHSDALAIPSSSTVLGFVGMGPLSRPPRLGNSDVIPANFDDLPRLLSARGRALVLLVQVTEADAAETHGLGFAVDHTYDLLGEARLVVAEVNAELPDTTAPRVPAAALDVMVPTRRAVPLVKSPEVGPIQQAIARHVVNLVPERATLQLGVGAVPTAIGRALADRRGLRVRSTLVGDWLAELAAAGALRAGAGAVVIAEAAGSENLYRFVAGGAAEIVPVSSVVGGIAAHSIERFVAVNSAFQIDLTGQVNAEETTRGYVGGIGGQTEFLRAAQRSRDGVSVIALPSQTSRGTSRIVRELSPASVTTPRAGVDYVVTEHGVADLRGRALRERRQLIAQLAAPEHRSELLQGAR